jgi:tetratricopeptide (TPR) repeat protein
MFGKNVFFRFLFANPICLAVSLCLMAACLQPGPAAAAKVMFGTQEHLVKIQDLDFKGPAGETLYLGHKYAQHSFIAPYMLTDDGYILGVEGQNRYFALDANLIEKLQATGKLPKPLPPYEIALIDYLFGYLLWIAIAAIVIFFLLSRRKDARAKQALPFAQAGVAHEQAGRYDAAIAEYDQALAIDPKLAGILCRRGYAHHSKGDYERAIADFSKAMSLAPKDDTPLLGRGAAFEAKSMLKQAFDDYSRAIKVSKSAIAYHARGTAHLRSGAFEAAIRDFTAAIKKDQLLVAAYQDRAVAYGRIGQRERAEADHRRAAQIGARQQMGQGASMRSA